MRKPRTAKEAIVLSSVAAGFAIAIPTMSNAAAHTPHHIGNLALDINPDMRYGYTGQPVKILQLELKKINYFHSNIDGKFGIDTRNAVKEFQKIHGLQPDGIASQATMDRIREVGQINFEPLKIGDHGEEVKKLQVKLQKLGFYLGDIDGSFGPITQKAVMSYQSQNNLQIDGIAGQKTMAHLNYNKNKKGKTLATVKIKQVSSYSVDTSVINIAKSLIGTPYKWGGVSPNGFDCSGFLKYVYKQKGINIPRTVNEIWNYGADVDKLSVGDIIFFQTYKPGPSHTGIYLGNGNFIHTDLDEGVTISNLSVSYWKNRYLGAKRIVQIF